jgi:prepilin-type N-terminal cleavage/methylation domain-containing protein
MQTNQRNGHAAFSLIEMMAVVTIIVILAGLVIGAMGFVTEKQARAKGQVQIQLLSKSLEEYKLDFGTYPPTTNSAKGEGNSKILFKALYWDSDNDGQGAAEGNMAGDVDQKIYVPELDPATNKQGWTSGKASTATKIVDPWNNEYRYRTATDSTGKNNTNTQNPDFDLWSVGKDGKTSPSSPADKENRDDIKNF